MIYTARQTKQAKGKKIPNAFQSFPDSREPDQEINRNQEQKKEMVVV